MALPDPGPNTTGWGEDLNAWLRAEHNADGTHTAGADTAADWKSSGHTATQVSTTQFQIAGADYTEVYDNGRRVEMILSGTSYFATVKSSSYAGGNTTVTVDAAVVPATIDTLNYSICAPASMDGGIPEFAYLGEWYMELGDALMAVVGSAPDNVLVDTDTPAAAFGAAADEKTRFAFRVPTKDQGIDISKDLVFHFEYSMSTSVASKEMSMNIDWRQNGGGATSVEDEITVPDDTSRATHDGTNLKIASGAYAAGDSISGVLWRDIDGVAANHTGDFQMIHFWVTNE